jgi:hypothetical protein
LGTHGLPLQQSALVAHAPPGLLQVASAQRGTPSLSCLQVPAKLPMPVQQSVRALHELVEILHTSPVGSQPMGSEQTPFWQVTGWLEVGNPASANAAEPQQSLLVLQVSPTTWQPVAGWQTSTPVGPYGAHERLQQAPPHAGIPPSV